MKARIVDLKPHMENVTIIAKVVTKSPVIDIKTKKYCSAIIRDETGEIKLNLWRDQVEQVKEGDLIRVTGAFVHVRMGVKQLSTWSNIEKVDPDNLSSEFQSA